MKDVTACDVCKKDVGKECRLELVYYSGGEQPAMYDICLDCGKDLYDKTQDKPPYKPFYTEHPTPGEQDDGTGNQDAL